MSTAHNYQIETSGVYITAGWYNRLVLIHSPSTAKGMRRTCMIARSGDRKNKCIAEIFVRP